MKKSINKMLILLAGLFFIVLSVVVSFDIMSEDTEAYAKQQSSKQFYNIVEIYKSTDLFILGDASYSNTVFVLKNDIDLDVDVAWKSDAAKCTDSFGWVPIQALLINCSFDGGGFTIKNLSMTHDHDYIGLFSVTNLNISNLNIEKATVIGTNNPDSTVGVLAGVSNGKITNVHITDSYVEGGIVGGIAGLSYNTVINSSYEGVVVGESIAGGLFGLKADDYIENCMALGSVSARIAGGLIGFFSDYVEIAVANCYADVVVCTQYEDYSYVGSFVGILHDLVKIVNSFTNELCAPIGSNDIGAGWAVLKPEDLDYKTGLDIDDTNDEQVLDYVNDEKIVDGTNDTKVEDDTNYKKVDDDVVYNGVLTVLDKKERSVFESFASLDFTNYFTWKDGKLQQRTIALVCYGDDVAGTITGDRAYYVEDEYAKLFYTVSPSLTSKIVVDNLIVN
ncbi:MAG: hypothetical protein LBE09_06350, partial [Christensenellaceae bacterium]|nr:hypothetical protein [Christensenellaceae bacterium]